MCACVSSPPMMYLLTYLSLTIQIAKFYLHPKPGPICHGLHMQCIPFHSNSIHLFAFPVLVYKFLTAFLHRVTNQLDHQHASGW
eukprot:m.141223 g.141223  ORF g.141223 m.141223 type:complete len:84 (-) comp37841_c0_seq1:117-368(-)